MCTMNKHGDSLVFFILEHVQLPLPMSHHMCVSRQNTFTFIRFFYPEIHFIYSAVSLHISRNTAVDNIIPIQSKSNEQICVRWVLRLPTRITGRGYWKRIFVWLSQKYRPGFLLHTAGFLFLFFYFLPIGKKEERIRTVITHTHKSLFRVCVCVYMPRHRHTLIKHTLPPMWCFHSYCFMCVCAKNARWMLARCAR